MMNTVALKLVGDVGWGLKFRVFVGAALSTLDLFTDVYITYTFWKDASFERIFYKSSIAMLGVSMLLMVSVCAHRNPPSVLQQYDSYPAILSVRSINNFIQICPLLAARFMVPES